MPMTRDDDQDGTLEGSQPPRDELRRAELASVHALLHQALRPLADVPVRPALAETVRARMLAAAMAEGTAPARPSPRARLLRFGRAATPVLIGVVAAGYFAWALLFVLEPFL